MNKQPSVTPPNGLLRNRLKKHLKIFQYNKNRGSMDYINNGETVLRQENRFGSFIMRIICKESITKQKDKNIFVKHNSEAKLDLEYHIIPKRVYRSCTFKPAKVNSKCQ